MITHDDSIVAELHATREKLAKRYRNDLTAYSKAAETHCRELGLTMLANRPLPGKRLAENAELAA